MNIRFVSYLFFARHAVRQLMDSTSYFLNNQYIINNTTFFYDAFRIFKK